MNQRNPQRRLPEDARRAGEFARSHVNRSDSGDAQPRHTHRAGERANDSVGGRIRNHAGANTRGSSTQRNDARTERASNGDVRSGGRSVGRNRAVSYDRGRAALNARAARAREHAAIGMQAVSARRESRRSSAVGLVAALLAVALVVFGLARCTHQGASPDSSTAETPTGYASPYDWNNLVYEDGRLSYVADGQTLSRLGIDVSEAQGAIDWQAVANDGVDFAIVRAGYRGTTEGDVYTDPMFDANIDGAIDAGLDVGVYFYSQALTEEEAREEAQLCLYEINGRELQYPVAFDYELTVHGTGRADNIDAAQAAANAKAFCEEIEKGGYEAILYGNQHDVARHGLTTLSEYPIWHSEYGTLPSADYPFVMWQYTNQGSVDGVYTHVDMNIDLSGI